MDNQQQPGGMRKLRLEVPAHINGVYSNGAIVSQTPHEIVLDFIQVMPNDPRARVQARIVMTPAAAKSFLRALEQNINRYEQLHGEIPIPPSLAEQLFGGVKSEDEGGAGGE